MPVMAMGVAELKRELKAEGGLTELPEIHQFLDGFYMSRIGIRILIGQHIALHEPQQKDHIGELSSSAVHDAQGVIPVQAPPYAVCRYLQRAERCYGAGVTASLDVTA